MRVWALLVLVFACVAPMAAADDDDGTQPGYPEIREHMIGDGAIIRAPWRTTAPSLIAQSYSEQWGVRVTVDESGAVTPVRLEYGPEAQREAVLAAARATRFRPFERSGRAVAVSFSLPVYGKPDDYVGPEDRTFPAEIDPATLRIRFQRTSCYGTCPAYSLDITGDGAVTYVGESSVLAVGAHHWRVPRENVDEIVALMRQADFFHLDGHYELAASDLPTYITALEIGGQRKYVLDYGGAGILGEGVIASTVMGSYAGPQMPRIVSEIERAIDRLAGVETYVSGDARTMEVLRGERFRFRSERGGFALAYALSNCKLDLARALIAEGAPTIARFSAFGSSAQPLILYAPHCGDVELVQLLIDRGLRSRDTATKLLQRSAATGFPDMLRLALRYSRAVNAHERGGDPPLMEAVQAFDPEEWDRDPLPPARFDRGETVALLLSQGADPHYRDDNVGWTALHLADDAGSVRALAAAGADANARDEDGKTPLFGQYDADAVRALLEAGADVTLKDSQGRTALHEAGGAAVVPLLVAAGLDPNALDGAGKTPLETIQGEDAAQALLAAGARLPDDPARMRPLVERARRAEWSTLLPIYMQHARDLGVEVDRQ